MPLMNIMPFVTSSKEVIRLSITTILRESKVHITIKKKLNVLWLARRSRTCGYPIFHRHLMQTEWHQSVRIHMRVIEKTAEWQPNTPWENIETYFLTDGKSSNSINLISCYCFLNIQGINAELTFYDTLMRLLGTKTEKSHSLSLIIYQVFKSIFSIENETLRLFLNFSK